MANALNFSGRQSNRNPREAGRLRGWEAGRLGGWEAGRLGGWKAGRLGSWEAGRLGKWEARSHDGEMRKGGQEGMT